MADSSLVLSLMELEVREDLSYFEEPVKILDRKEQILRSKSISLVKVLWRHHVMDEATWEGEKTMKTKYPYLFVSGAYPKFRGRNSLSRGEL